MAEEVSDGQFKAEMLEFKTDVMRFVEVANQKFDGLTSDVRTNSFHLDRLETKVDSVEAGLQNVKTDLADVKAVVTELSSEVKTLSGQFRDVGVMAIKDNIRITNVEKRVDDLETGVH